MFCSLQIGAESTVADPAGFHPYGLKADVYPSACTLSQKAGAMHFFRVLAVSDIPASFHFPVYVLGNLHVRALPLQEH